MSHRTRNHVRTSLALAVLAALTVALGHACYLVDNPKYCNGSLEPGSPGAPTCNCDRETNTCIPDAGTDGPSCDGEDCGCAEHVDCAGSSGICIDGECLGVDEVVRVNLTSTEPSETNCGDAAANPPQEPCRAIQSGLQRAMDLGRMWVSVAANGSSYRENLTVPDINVNIIALPGAVVMPSSAGPVIDLPDTEEDRYVLIEGLEMRHDPDTTGPTDVGVRCSGGTLHLRSTVVADAGGVGVDVSGMCTFLMERTRVLDNNGGGVNLAAAASFSLAQNIIARNGNDMSAFGGIRIESPVSMTGTLDFNTIVKNEADMNLETHGGVICAPSADIFASNNIVIDNLYAKQQVQGARCTWRSSVLIPGSTGVYEDTVGASCPYDGMTYLLTGESAPCLDGGDRSQVEGLDPRITLDRDIDGDPRPAGDSGWDVGADEFVAE